MEPTLLNNDEDSSLNYYGLTEPETSGIAKPNDDVTVLEKLGGINKIVVALSTDLESGLMSNDFEDRKLSFGTNKFDEPPRSTWFELFAEALKDEAVIILIISAVVSFLAGIGEAFIGKAVGDEWIEGVTILVAVLIVASVTATNDYMKDDQFRKLKLQNSDRKVRVLRKGEEMYISVFDVCVGDVVVLHSGDKIPADGVFIPGIEEIRVDESSITGEPEHKRKGVQSPFLFSGCNISKGSGKMLVTAVGMNTFWGKTIALIPDEHPPTPLQEKLEDLVTLIGKIGLAVAILVFSVLFGYYVYDSIYPTDTVPCTNNVTLSDLKNGSMVYCGEGMPSTVPGHVIIPGKWEPKSLEELLGAFIVAVTIVVVAVPEGLPLAVTISLAYSVQQMASDQNLVRHLSACETMGGATNICSDKTGTLTENRMAVQQGLIMQNRFASVEDLKGTLNKETQSLLMECFVLNIEDGLLNRDSSGRIVFSGNTTECAVLVLAEKLDRNYLNLRHTCPLIQKWGFTSDRKRMASVIRTTQGTIRFHIKGAMEMILSNCTHLLNEDGTQSILDQERSSEIINYANGVAKSGLRTLAFAYKDFEAPQDWSADLTHFETGLVFVGIVAIEDPIRPEVPDSVLICQKAGIFVRMITGDNALTASKIASDCHILTKNGVTLEGPQFEKMTDQEILNMLPNLQVLARSTPAHKFRLVSLLRDSGEVVAVTGDGTNDAPALSAADVGLAMGIAGTEVAKQAADIIILDDNFASIVKSVTWGRCVFDNVRKFLQFQVTVNVAALAIAFIGAITGYGTPLNSIQLLWVNLIMDTLAALALGTEKPTQELLLRKPYGRAGKLITWIMWRNIIGHSLFQIIVLAFLLYGFDLNQNHLILPNVKNGKEAFDNGDPSTHYTIIFNVFVFCQVFNEINSRKVTNEMNVFKGIFTNPLFSIILSMIVFVQVLLVQFGANAIKTVALTWDQWLICIGIASITIPLGFIIRSIRVPLETWEEQVITLE